MMALQSSSHPDLDPNDLCYRCKRVECKGTKSCIFESNVFYASQSLQCQICLKVTTKGEDLVTLMKRGMHNGFCLHRNCALMWYEANPKIKDESHTLKFHMPPPELIAFSAEFINGTGEIRQFDIDATAGSGKTNLLVYIASQLRAKKISFKMFMFTTPARKTLLERGLQPHEVTTFHSYGRRAYIDWVKLMLGEEAIMRGCEAQEPKVVYYKQRLVVSMLFRGDPDCVALVALLRSFITEVSELARTHAYGHPTYGGDLASLREIVDKYNLTPLLLKAWSTVLTQPQKLTLERRIGAGEERLLEFAILQAANSIDLSLQVACQLEVLGQTSLFNEVTKKKFALPIIDLTDMKFIMAVKNIEGGRVERVLVDEKQDMDHCEILITQSAVASHGFILTVGDQAQGVYAWRGSQRDSINAFTAGARKVTAQQNWRCARSICIEAQKFLDLLDIGIQIQPMRDVEGIVTTGTFHSHPIDLNQSTLILARSKEHALVLSSALRTRGYPVQMHGTPEASAQLILLLEEYHGTLAQRQEGMQRAFDAHSQTTSDSNKDHELLEALLILLDIYLKSDGAQDPHAYKSHESFVAFVHKFHEPGADTKGVVVVATCHASKSREADRVYLINGESVPLQDRVALGGWQRYEELCVAFVATTRAKNELIKLKDIGHVTRQSIDDLFLPAGIDAPADEAEKSTQETAECNSQESNVDEHGDLGADVVEAATSKALATLGLQILPDTYGTLLAAVRVALRETNSGRSSVPISDILEARALLQKVIGK